MTAPGENLVTRAIAGGAAALGRLKEINGLHSAFFLLGAGAGLLAGLALPLPWMSPLNGNVLQAAITIGAALFSIGGAYLFWRHQQRTRSAAIEKVFREVFLQLLLSLRGLYPSLYQDRFIEYMGGFLTTVANSKGLPIEVVADQMREPLVRSQATYALRVAHQALKESDALMPLLPDVAYGRLRGLVWLLSRVRQVTDSIQRLQTYTIPLPGAGFDATDQLFVSQLTEALDEWVNHGRLTLA